MMLLCGWRMLTSGPRGTREGEAAEKQGHPRVRFGATSKPRRSSKNSGGRLMSSQQGWYLRRQCWRMKGALGAGALQGRGSDAANAGLWVPRRWREKRGGMSRRGEGPGRLWERDAARKSLGALRWPCSTRETCRGGPETVGRPGEDQAAPSVRVRAHAGRAGAPLDCRGRGRLPKRFPSPRV